MVWKTIVALPFAAVSSNALSQEVSSDPLNFVSWEYASVSGSVFWVVAKDITRENDNKIITAWVRGDHSSDKSVSYRSSVSRVTLNCNGLIRTSAYTSYSAEGKAIKSWNGFGTDSYIRPDTMFADLERKLCGKK